MASSEDPPLLLDVNVLMALELVAGCAKLQLETGDHEYVSAFTAS